MSSQAFVPRVCPTGEDTGTVLGSITAVQDGSLIDPFYVCSAPPPFGEAARLPIVPPPVGNWYPRETCVVREDTEANRPAAGCTDPCGCRFFWATDKKELWYDDCEEWVLINVCVVLEDECANRPPPCTQPCKIFYATDTKQFYYDDCDEGGGPPVPEWILLNPCLLKEGVIADLPATPVCNTNCNVDACTFYYATDTGELFFADCVNDKWILVNPCVVLEGECADIPPSGSQPCKLFWATDTLQFYFDDVDSGEWILLNPCPFKEGLEAARPATPACSTTCDPNACWFYYSTDIETLYYADCVNDKWILVNPCVVLEGDIADIPPAGCTQPCKLFWAIDEQLLYYDDCVEVEWVPIGACVVLEGTFASRPPPGCVQPCRLFFATDEQTLWFDDCDAVEWILINPCVVLEAPFADRPPACSQPCRLFWATDNQTLWYDDCLHDEWVAIGGGSFDESTAVLIGACEDSSVMDEDPENPGTIVWDVNTQDPSEEGMILHMLTRIIYKIDDDGGNEILYGFCRTLGFDTAGKLAALSGEERTIIDEPELCQPT